MCWNSNNRARYQMADADFNNGRVIEERDLMKTTSLFGAGEFVFIRALAPISLAFRNGGGRHRLLIAPSICAGRVELSAQTGHAPMPDHSHQHSAAPDRIGKHSAARGAHRGQIRTHRVTRQRRPQSVLLRRSSSAGRECPYEFLCNVNVPASQAQATDSLGM